MNITYYLYTAFPLHSVAFPQLFRHFSPSSEHNPPSKLCKGPFQILKITPLHRYYHKSYLFLFCTPNHYVARKNLSHLLRIQLIQSCHQLETVFSRFIGMEELSKYTEVCPMYIVEWMLLEFSWNLSIKLFQLFGLCCRICMFEYKFNVTYWNMQTELLKI